MSTKIFALKVQSPKATTPPKDYILVLNEHLTPNDFITDIHELYPAIPTANGKLGLVLDGSYRMPPRQFLRYMMSTVAYTPEVKGGICVPKLFGRGNGIMIDYEEGLEPAQPTASRQSTVSGNVPSSANMGKLAKAVAAMKIGENPSASSTENVKSNKTQPRPPPPTHENTNHVMIVNIGQVNSISPRVRFSTISIENVPTCGGLRECLWLESEILARLPDWLDPLTVKLSLLGSVFSTRSSDFRMTWNEDSFRWSESTGQWLKTIYAEISW
ncbi:hypothetical protein BGX38DRAFT_1142709 [Terfezia claveryi]|nr:hypothetical protein BGX38DRAFT_1142709 [Terfezia claveryi]